MTGWRNFIAVDWGTTNRRIYRIDDRGRATLCERSPAGVLGMPQDGYDAAVADIRFRFGDLPILMAGMVGSNRGWRDAGYVEAPADLGAIARNILWIEPGMLGIVPGVLQNSASMPDVMRGEEVQILGAVASGLASRTGRLCQPGTHSKWARLKNGAITEFATAMTGELFALLRDHSLLADHMKGESHNGPAFREGVSDALSTDLLSAMFRVRAACLTGIRHDRDGAAYVSGLLIGADVSAHLRANETVHLISDPQLGELYDTAIAMRGARCVLIDSSVAFAAGIAAIRENFA